MNEDTPNNVIINEIEINNAMINDMSNIISVAIDKEERKFDLIMDIINQSYNNYNMIDKSDVFYDIYMSQLKLNILCTTQYISNWKTKFKCHIDVLDMIDSIPM